ncbi:NUMOD3 domain-containing DNA-binding protein [Streptomyces sp. NPDC058394]|uniref:NUMOD3 domain-containing DNA-binding protein n=1 Tax=Streptomyces sp. NPDC058394 TaxID=3346477 RepID=UPI00365E1747
MPATGRKHTDETKDRIRAARTGQKHSDETKDRMRAAHTGRKQTEETKDRIRAALTGRKQTEETKDRISAALTGRKHSDETKDRMSATALARAARKKAEAASASPSAAPATAAGPSTAVAPVPVTELRYKAEQFSVPDDAPRSFLRPVQWPQTAPASSSSAIPAHSVATAAASRVPGSTLSDRSTLPSVAAYVETPASAQHSRPQSPSQAGRR